MQVILQQEVANLGKVGDQVSVKPGFGRNFLLPQGMAVLATPENIADFEARRAEFEKNAAKVLSNAQNRAKALAEIEIVIEAQAGDEGKLFGSIGPRDIAVSATQKGIAVEKKEVVMPEGPIRQLGEYQITLKLHNAVMVPVKVKVISETSSSSH
ncbi:MAG: 50S ribosomal protein L9 [Proteobacteria bacterium]|nr:50S ribosomal protein L9 [Pseudomonadota bacterium]